MTSDDIAGKWVRDAEETGELKSSKNFGKPLDLEDGFAQTPEELKIAFKVLKNSGFVPGEVGLFKELEGLRGKLAEETDGEERKALQKQIADKQLKIQVFAEQKKL